MIYDRCLDIGAVFPHHWFSGAVKGSFPPVTLLRVCKISEGAAENDRQHLWCMKHKKHDDLDVGAMGYKTPWEQRTSSKHG